MDSIQSCFRCSEDLGGAGQQLPTPARVCSAFAPGFISPQKDVGVG